MDTLRSHK